MQAEKLQKERLRQELTIVRSNDKVLINMTVNLGLITEVPLDICLYGSSWLYAIHYLSQAFLIPIFMYS